MELTYIRPIQRFLLYSECPLFGVSFIGGSTVVQTSKIVKRMENTELDWLHSFLVGDDLTLGAMNTPFLP